MSAARRRKGVKSKQAAAAAAIAQTRVVPVAAAKVTATTVRGRIFAKDDASVTAARRYFAATRAYHEAAHVCVAAALGCRVGTVTLDPEEGRALSGRNSFVGAAAVGDAEAQPHERAMIAAAGIVWEAYFGAPGARPSGPAALAVCAANAPTDWHRFESLVAEVERPSVLAAVRTLLDRLAPDILELGAALQAKGRLAADEALAILRAADERRTPS